MLEYKVHQFSNGLKVVTAPLKSTKAVTIFVLFGVGSRYEDERLSGISHFLEHMFFKGTKNRPTTLDISRELDGVGANYNAFTGEEYTGYFIRVPSEHFDLGLDVLQDMLFNSKFDSAEIEREKGVIVEEINMYNDDPKSRVELVAKELIFNNHPLGRKITGERETVTKFNRDDFVDYKNTFYEPKNAVLVVAGGQDHGPWLEKLEEKFGKFSGNPAPTYEKVEIEQKEPQLSIDFRQTDQAHFILSFRSIKRTDEKRPIFKVLTNLMGQMMSSRLFIEVREKRGLCYYVYSEMSDFNDTGVWSVIAGVDVNRIEEALSVILDQIERLKTELVSEEELKRAQENLKGHLYLSLEESLAVANYLAEQQLFWGKIEDPEEVAKKFEQVTPEQIKEAANEFFTAKNLNLAIVGPFKEKEKFQKILERMDNE